MPRSIQVSKLKATLSAELKRVKAGEEILVTERGEPVARIVPYRPTGDEYIDHLVRKGVLLPPQKPFRPLKLKRVFKDPNRARQALDALLKSREEERY